MLRKPFDPSRARGGLFDAAPPAPPAQDPRTAGAPGPISVTQVCERIRSALETTGKLAVVGEVSNFSPRNHWYFSIKDSDAVLNCVLWASTVARTGFQPANGMEVVVTGRLTYYGTGARTQMVVEKLERRGQGTLQQQFEELCRVLRDEGYFADARKRPLPAHPRRIAVITARHGAALQDVLRTAQMRAPWVRILVVEVPVQGAGAADEVARAIRVVDRRADALGIDAMIVTRGGGSLEDLWAFNERVVADAVFASVTPIVAAIGHETDTTVIELVADRRASTPTQAAMLLLPDREQLAEHVSHLTDRLGFLVRKRVRDAERTLVALARHAAFRSPQAMLAPRRTRVDTLAMRLAAGPRARLERAARRLAEAQAAFERQRPAVRQAVAAQRLRALEARLHATMAAQCTRAHTRLETLRRHLGNLGPEQVLARGYSLTLTNDGAVLRRAADAPEGTELTTRLAEGVVHSTVHTPADDAQREE